MKTSLLAWVAAVVCVLGASLGPVSVAQAETASKQRPAKVVKSGVKAKSVASKPRKKQVVVAKQRKVSPKKSNRQHLAKVSPKRPVVRASVPARLSYGEIQGLRAMDDPLNLNSSVALVLDQETQEVLFSKNEGAVLPIASLTKLMTGMVVSDAQLPMDEMITITQADVDTYKGSRSRLAVGSRLSRGELMHLALMSSENRAAHALGRTFPGGMSVFVTLMNAKASELGMLDTRFVEPTGLSSENQSSASDLAKLALASYDRPLIRNLSTSPGHFVDLGRRTLEYRNSNRLVRDAEWDIGLQKTGYISEAGRCLVMQASVAGRNLIMVFLDARDTRARIGDAERVRRWVERRFDALGSAERPRG